ncbi:coiled-coil domain-containing protein 74B isoform X2 [Ictalurus punctatus]|uniref:Coiled-coil domain-containing protein 74B isoform X2 n=1 Tax=Ictalurus punctatus TaxID=7998 RepID=A0A2D0SYY1_ICTPU|nr:coiled-coil domain-containing protein 74B isoform X2 [Ictalurus punctatus]
MFMSGHCSGSSCKAQKHWSELTTFESGREFYLEQTLEDTRLPQDTHLWIHSSPSEPPRSPTLRECGVIIRQLYNANSLQSQEILRIKAILRDIMFNRKITPENYIMAKAYLADEKRAEEPEMFPKLPSRALPKGPVVCQAKMAERVILPSLTQSLSRRTRAVQRSRLWRKIP